MRDQIRTGRENDECEKRDREEWDAIRVLNTRVPGPSQDEYYKRKKERARRQKRLDLRLKGWTQEQIDNMERERAEERARPLNLPPGALFGIGPPIWGEGWSGEISQPQRLSRAQATGTSRETRGGGRTTYRQPAPKAVSRKTRGGRVAKKTAQEGQTALRQRTRPRQPGPTTAGRASNRTSPAGMGEHGQALHQHSMNCAGVGGSPSRTQSLGSNI